MINQQSTHILNQLGVITSFSVAKKITEDDINKFFSKYKKIGKSESEIEKLLKEQIVKEIQDAIANQNIPGLITLEEIAKEMGVDKNIIKNISELNRIITVVSRKMLEKRYNKMSLCYFVNGLVNMLNLDESDFEKFHRNNSGNEEGDDGEEYNDV